MNKHFEKRLERIIENSCDDMVYHLRHLIKIPSVSEEADGIYPFGKTVYRAYDYMMKLAHSMGFTCRNFENYAGDISYGDSENPADYVGAVVHMDVVPAGDGWTVKPFSGDIIDEKLYGRGTTDNKGCAVALLYAMYAIKASGIKMKKGIRLIVGCSEENGVFPCIKYYMQRTGLPESGIVPDAFFPAVFAEKGFYTFLFRKKFIFDNGDDVRNSIIITGMDGGTAVNVVPSFAKVEFRIGGGADAVVEKLKLIGEKEGGEFSRYNDRIEVAFYGKEAHASRPELGENAINKMLGYLSKIEYQPENVCKTIRRLTDAISYDMNGIAMGIDYEDVTGKLTNNVGVLQYDGKELIVKMNARCPVTIEHKMLEEQLNENANKLGMEFSLINYNPPFYIDKNDKLIQKLVGIYRKETGDYESEPIAHGAGSYARIMENFVPFGPMTEKEELLFHQPDENISIDKLLEITKIYAKALIALG